MNKKLRYELTTHLDELRSQYEMQSTQFEQLKEFSKLSLKARYRENGIAYYSVLDPANNKYKYIGKSNASDIKRIKYAHYLSLSNTALKKEIQLTEDYLNRSQDVDFQAINSKLSKVYRVESQSDCISESELASDWKKRMIEYKATFPPFRPEELIHKTQDGQYTRSKGEALIYNSLLNQGVCFIYELPLKIKAGSRDALLLPDFTILSEFDYESVVFIEHQGKMNSSNYRNKFNESVYKYWSNYYIPERDVFFTFDLPNGGFDDTPIKNIITSYIRPKYN